MEVTTITTENPTPKVGDGATILQYSDRHACTIVAVSKSGRTITLKRDKATLLNGPKSGEPDAMKFSVGGFFGHMSGTQRYSYEPDPTATEQKATLRKDGHYHIVGAGIRSGKVLIGVRREHYDHNF